MGYAVLNILAFCIEPALLKMLNEAIKAAGVYTLTPVTKPDAVYFQPDLNSPQLVVIDDSVSYYAHTQGIKRKFPEAQIIVVLGGEPKDVVVQALRDAGAQNVLVKPSCGDMQVALERAMMHPV